MLIRILFLSLRLLLVVLNSIGFTLRHYGELQWNLRNLNSSIFTHEELGATLNLMLLVTVKLIFMLQIKLLALPLYRIGKQFGG